MPWAAYVRNISVPEVDPSARYPSAIYGDGELLQFPSGDTVRILVDGETSNGALAVLDCTHVAGPSERHSHADANKSVFVLAGRYRFAVGDGVRDAGPGDQVFIGRGVPHDFTVGVHGGRALFVFSPAGVEEYFRALAAMVETDSSPVSIDALRRHHHIHAVVSEPTPPAPAEDL